MADVQHIAELGFDFSAVPKQFEELEALLIAKGTKLSDIWKKSFTLEGAAMGGVTTEVRRTLGDLQREADHAARAVGMSWKKAKASLLEEGNTGAGLTEYFKRDGKKMAVQWTDEFERHFAYAAPELRKSLSSYIKWTDDKSGIPFDNLTGEIKEAFAQLNHIDNPLDMLERVNDAIVRYRELRDDRIKNGLAEGFREITEAAEGSVDAIRKIADAFEGAQGGEGIGRGGMYSEEDLRRKAELIREQAAYQAELRVETDKTGEVTGATLTYLDELNNKYVEQYRHIERVNGLTSEVEVGFEKIKATVVESSEAHRRLSEEVERAAAALVNQNTQNAAFFEKLGDKQAVARLQEINGEVQKLLGSTFTYDKQQKLRIAALAHESGYYDKQKKDEQARLSVLTAQNSEHKKILSLATKTAELQAKMRKHPLDNAVLREEGELLRAEIDTYQAIAKQGRELTAQERERLGILEKRVGVLQTEYAVARSDSVGFAHDDKDDGLLARSGKWFGAYQMWHVAKRAVASSVTTMRDVEMQMMEISRVLELTANQSDSLRDKIFGLAGEFGREFESASDIVLRFAQAGYSVTESLTLTRSALLAMNTAELDAENSTRSLVGILKQWGLSADDLMGVIDKLNFTADNASMTTQDLVDAMLRASASAKNAKFSLEETVGIIVALGEASGRSGKEVGTAFNSMISYTQKASSLQAFEGLGIKVWADEQQTTLRSILDIWQDLARMVSANGEAVFDTLERQTDMTGLFSQEMAEAAGAGNEYNAMLEYQHQLNETSLNDAERQTVYEQFGIYRRNYLIALLSNFSRAQEVVNDMHNAEGHSLQENSRYMETLEAKYQQLIAALHELAVQAGEAGLMDLAKGAVQLATGLTKAAKAVGGIVPLLVTVTGLVTLLKRQKVTEAMGQVITNLTRLKAALMNVAAAQKAVDANGKAITLGMGGWLGIGLMAFSLISSAITKVKQGIEQTRERSREMTEEWQRSAKELHDATANLKELEDEYSRLSQGVDEYGNNVSLSADEYSRYRDIVAQVLDMHPSLITGYDEEGNRLYKNNTLLSDAVELQAQLNELKRQEYLEDAKTHLKTLRNDREEYEDKIASLHFIPAVDYDSGKFADETFKELLARAGLDNTFELHFGNLGHHSNANLLENTELLQEMYEKRSQIIEQARGVYADDEVNALAQSLDNLGLYLHNLEQYDSQMQGLLRTAVMGKDWYKSLPVEVLDEFDAKLRELATDSGLSWKKMTTQADSYGFAVSEAFNAMPWDKVEALREGLKNGSLSIEDFMAQWQALERELYGTAGSDEARAAVKMLGDDMRSLADAAAQAEEGVAPLNDAIAAWLGTIAQGEDVVSGLDNAIRSLESAMQTLAEVDGGGLSLDSALELIAAYPELISAVQWSGEAFYFEAEAMEAARQAQYSLRMEQEMAIIAGEISAGLTDAQRVALVNLSGELRSATDATARQAAMTEYLAWVNANAAASTDALAGALARLQMIGFASTAPVLPKARSSGGGGGGNRQQQELQRQQRETEKSYKGQEEAVKKRYQVEIDALKALKKEQSREDDRADYEKARAELLEERGQMEQRTSREAVERIRKIDKELEELDEKERRRQRDTGIDDAIADLELRRDTELEAIKAAAEAAKEAYQAQIEQLRQVSGASGARYRGEVENLQVLNTASAQVAGYIEQEFRQLYQDIVDHSSEAARLQILNNQEVYMSVRAIREEMLGLGMGPISMDTYLRETTGQGKPSLPGPGLPSLRDRMAGTASLEDYPKSHTGSVIARDGLVNLEAGEIVVRSDISAGLIDLVQRQRFADVAASKGTQVAFYAPLMMVERQEIAGTPDAQRAAGNVGKLIMKELRKLPR